MLQKKSLSKYSRDYLSILFLDSPAFPNNGVLWFLISFPQESGGTWLSFNPCCHLHLRSTPLTKNLKWNKCTNPGKRVYLVTLIVLPLFLGSCNGLVLLNNTNDLFLWNPVTSYFKKVFSIEELGDDWYPSVISGLCYDSLSDEYKAVMALSHGRYSSNRCHQIVMVSSLKSKDWGVWGFPFELRVRNQDL